VVQKPVYAVGTAAVATCAGVQFSASGLLEAAEGLWYYMLGIWVRSAAKS